MKNKGLSSGIDVLYNFISPITGRLPLTNDYILIGALDNFSVMSPKLIDMQLDIINIRHYVDNIAASSFIIGFPNNDLPKAQVLSNLDNGFLFNTDGIISTQGAVPLPSLAYKNIWIGDENNKPVASPTILQTNLPPLSQNNIWIGDSNNLAQPKPTITIDNLPNLGTTSINVPNPLDPTNPIVISGGKIWHGTDSNRPEESNALLVVEGDIALINFRFFSANFILGKGNSVLQTLMPGSQFLSNLPSGSWMQTSAAGTGAIVAATIEQNQLLMGGLNNVPEARQTIDIANLPSLADGRVWQGDAANRPVEVQLNLAPTDATYIIKTPNVNLPEAQVLEELGIGMAKIVAGGAFAIAIAGEDYATVAQLEEIRDQCQQYAEQAATSAEEAATSAGEAATSAGEAAASATEATGAAAEATGAAAAASGSATAAGLSAAGALASAGAAALSAGSASSSASDASSSASDAGHSASNASGSATNAANSATAAQDYLNTLLNTGLTLQGDVTGSGLLSTPIVTVFTPNPVFTGKKSMTIPVGNNLDRPDTLTPGMMRFNTSL